MLKLPCLALACSCLLVSCQELQRLQHDTLVFSGAAGLSSAHEVSRAGHWVLPRNTSFYVALSRLAPPRIVAVATNPEAPLPTPQSPVADTVSDLLTEEISLRFPRVMRAAEPESLYDARMSAISNGIDYVVFPRLLLWEDTAGTWSEVADSLRYRQDSELMDSFGLDRARVQVTLLEAGSGHIVDVVVVSSRGGLLTLYGENPQRLLAAAVGRYAESLVP